MSEGWEAGPRRAQVACRPRRASTVRLRRSSSWSTQWMDVASTHRSVIVANTPVGVAPALLRGEHCPQALTTHDELADNRTGD